MSKKRVQSRSSHRPLPEVEAFIRLIHSNLSTAQGSPQGGIWFSGMDEGSLFLDPGETKTYRALVAQLIDKFVTERRRAAIALMQMTRIEQMVRRPASRCRPVERRHCPSSDCCVLTLNSCQYLWSSALCTRALSLNQGTDTRIQCRGSPSRAIRTR